MTVYRITKSKRASDLSGYGSALFPGRWNKKSSPVLYTGNTKEIALLENLVHLPAMMTPQLDILVLEIPDDSILVQDISRLPQNWAQFPPPTILSTIGQEWIDEGKFLALTVPSSIIPESKNTVLNCSHPRYAEVKVVDQRVFKLDTRLINVR